MFDVRSFDEGERVAILRGIRQAHAEIRAGGGRGETINGWLYPERHLGNFGDDYLYRAQVALGGLAALEPAEAAGLICIGDADGRPLDGTDRYRLRFEPGQLPPAKAFWSLTVYEVTAEGRAFLVDNPLSRYAIGDRTRGLVHAADGSLEIALQHDRPASERETNWLPTPAGPMRLVLRAYEPTDALLDGSYRMPPVRMVAIPG
jgi:hypothetical protein